MNNALHKTENLHIFKKILHSLHLRCCLSNNDGATSRASCTQWRRRPVRFVLLLRRRRQAAAQRGGRRLQHLVQGSSL
jgi:hypothetical protein